MLSMDKKIKMLIILFVSTPAMDLVYQMMT